MMSKTKSFALALLTLIGAPAAHAAELPNWMSEVDFIKGNWVQDGQSSSTLTVDWKTKPASLMIKHRIANGGAIEGKSFDIIDEQHIYEMDGKLQADDKADDIPHPPIVSHFPNVLVIPNKSIILTMTVGKTGGVGVELSYWACEWDLRKLCLSYSITREKFVPSHAAQAIFTRH